MANFKGADADVLVEDIRRENGISDAAYYNWKSSYGCIEDFPEYVCGTPYLP